MSHLLRTHHGGWRRTPAHLRPPTADHSGLAILPEVDPRKKLPPIYDQGQLGSCTANTAGAAFRYDAILDSKDPGDLSRLWIYYQERKLEHELGQGDTGAYGHDAFKAASTVGVCREADWPYTDDQAVALGNPPAKATADETHYKLRKPYLSVQPTVAAFKAVLSNRQTIAFGFTVYESFESEQVARTGIVPRPANGERQLGGHEVLCVGYLKARPNYALVRNSWGTSWGLAGYCLFPWAMLVDPKTSGDWTTIRRAG